MRRSCGDPGQILSIRSLHDPELTEDPVEILVRSSLGGPCMKILHMPCVRGAWMKAFVGSCREVLVSRSCKIFYDFARFFVGVLA